MRPHYKVTSDVLPSSHLHMGRRQGGLVAPALMLWVPNPLTLVPDPGAAALGGAVLLGEGLEGEAGWGGVGKGDRRPFRSLKWP